MSCYTCTLTAEGYTHAVLLLVITTVILKRTVFYTMSDCVDKLFRGLLATCIIKVFKVSLFSHNKLYRV